MKGPQEEGKGWAGGHPRSKGPGLEVGSSLSTALDFERTVLEKVLGRVRGHRSYWAKAEGG